MKKVWIALCCVAAALAAIAVGANDGPDAAPNGETVSRASSGQDGWQPVYNDEALPCTGSREPVNFETFSLGPSVAKLPLTYTERRCDGGLVVARANYVSYIYGSCEIQKGETGCQPPLEIQSWPACQRFFAKYSFEGEPPAHRRLPKRGGAEVVEFDFALDNRIEVYTKATTIVIFAIDQDLARKAVDMLRPREKGKPPALDADALAEKPVEGLPPPSDGSMEGALSCR